MARLVRADRRTAVTQVTTLYNCGKQKSTSERTTRRNLRWMCYISRSPRQVKFLPVKNKSEAAVGQTHQKWIVDDWKNVVWSDESQFLLRHRW